MPLLIKKIKSKSGKVHFKRWRLLTTPWFDINLHGIYKEDEDKHLHNHPWSILTIILIGCYTEELEDDKESFRWPLSIAYRSREKFHKIKMLHSNYVYSLAITSKRRTEWGYNVNGIFVDHKTYREQKNKISLGDGVTLVKE